MSTLEPQPAGAIPVPRPSRLSQPYWEGCAAGELRFQRCRDCGAVVFQPSYVCSNCTSRNLGWEVSEAKGRLYSWTVVWRPQTPAFQVPYAPAIVAMDEGFHLVTAMVGCEPEDLRADLAVTIEFHPVGDGVLLPYARPSPST